MVLGIFIASFSMALVSHAPGGLGVLEIAVLKGMPDVPQANVVAALLVFRLLYLIMPFVFALGVVLVFERHRWRALAPSERRPCLMPSAITIGEQDVLLAIDMQADFMPGGALAVDDGDTIVPLINALMRRFVNVVVTQDWHPPGHASFSSPPSRRGAVRVTKRLDYGEQTLWPDHCVQGTAAPHCIPTWRAIWRSSFCARACSRASIPTRPSSRRTERRRPGSRRCCKARGVKRVFACGLATDYCVAFSALDARADGFETFVIEDACRAIDANSSLDAAWARMSAAGGVAHPVARAGWTEPGCHCLAAFAAIRRRLTLS